MEHSETTDPGLRIDAPVTDLEDERIRASLGAKLFGRREQVEVDRFVLREQLGSGGMGVVYRADDPVLERSVALKVVRPDRATPRMRESLLHEARLVARLQHPNVVAVYEAGEQDEVVWIAMELVEGPTLREWLDPARPWREIVPVFMAAGEGLAEAHRQGLVHRDFKPENVLVEARPEGGVRPRVVDFGVALAERDSTDAAVAGTPAYMAPEQLVGDDVDARADQFAFCVALCEAVSGQRPTHMLATQSDITALRAELVPPAQGRWPRWLHRVMCQGLDPDPARRFASMDALLEALRRGLESRRRRLGLSAAAVVLGSAVAIALVRAPDPCADAGVQADAVWNPQAKSELRDWFDPTRGSFHAGSAQAVEAGLDRWTSAWQDARVDACRASQVERRQSDALQDLRDACLHRALLEVDGWLHAVRTNPADTEQVGKAVAHLGRLPELAACADTDTLRRELAFTGDAARRDEVDALWDAIATAKGAAYAGRWEPEALQALLDQALALEYSPVVAASAHVLALGELTHGDRDQAKEHLSLAYHHAIRGRADRLSADAALLRAWADLEGRNDLQEGRRWLDDAESFVAAMGDPPTLRSAWLDHAGVLASFEGRHADSERLHRQALALRNTIDADSIAAGQSRTNLGIALMRLHRLDEAREEIETARDVTVRRMGSHHPQVGKAENNLAAVLQRMGDHAGAQQALDRALEVKTAVFGATHPALASTFVNRANNRWEMGDHDGALEDLERAIEIRGNANGERHPSLLIPLINLGFSLCELDRHGEAEPHVLRAQSIALESGAKPDVVYARRALAQVYAGQGRAAEAVGVYEQLSEWMEADGELACDQAEAFELFADAVAKTGDTARAVGLRGRAAQLGETHACSKQ